MKLGDVLKKERERQKLTINDVALKLGISGDTYQELEAGNSPIEEWGPRLAKVAIKLKSPTSRLISETGKSANANPAKGGCAALIKAHREKRALGQEELANSLGISVEEIALIENGESPLETYAPLLLHFAELVEQPIFNLFYPCGLPLDQLNDYP
jgi:transcriptional regulator with XRE-family HTH domain